jgi:hypothetical protein
VDLLLVMWSLSMWDGILIFNRLNRRDGKAPNTEDVAIICEKDSSEPRVV